MKRLINFLTLKVDLRNASVAFLNLLIAYTLFLLCVVINFWLCVAYAIILLCQ